MLAVTSLASADPTRGAAPTADPPERTQVPTAGPGHFKPSWDLDGTYLWLGPSGAASHVDADWDSTVGVDAALVRVRERAAISVVGGSLGASRWTARGGGRIWLDAVLGTPVLGKQLGLSAGPIVELSDFAHPRLGASIGIWGFIGITPFARVGTVQELGLFGEVGIHLALPVLHR
ncbi:MAG TPA: hypothetical protein VFQ53_42185 [Kofleriaceae bacterium]|nr:hypothetical protein [Kofleriaceae bacterium]